MATTNTLNVSNTVDEFRSSILGRNGLQIAGFYKVTFVTGTGDSISCYPLKVVLPGRGFKMFEHEIWGPSRKIPVKRTYTDCIMTFIMYQDFQERTFLETWMNSVLKYQDGGPSDKSNNPQDRGNLEPAGTVTEIWRWLTGATPVAGNYKDFSTYKNNVGTIIIDWLNSQDKSIVNRSIGLREAYPSAISQVTLGADGSSYPTFTVNFEYNDYIYS